MSQFSLDDDTYRDILETTYDLGMFRVDFDDGFELTSGATSPLYIDARRWTQDPDAAEQFVSAMQTRINAAGIDYDVIAGGVTAGVPYAERLAHAMGEPSIYIRGEPKGHGRAAQIEGMDDLDGEQVLLVEDLITNGGSKLEFVDGVERAGGTVTDCIAFYDRQQGGTETLAAEDIQLYTVVQVDDLMEYGYETDRIDQEEYRQLQDYLAESP